MLLILLSAVSVSACLGKHSRSSITPQQRERAVHDMIEHYHCVWYHHLDGDEVRSERLISDAVDIGTRVGLGPEELFAVYNEARTLQRSAVDTRAFDMAQQRAPKIPKIMGSTVVQPTEDDHRFALLDLYREACTRP